MNAIAVEYARHALRHTIYSIHSHSYLFDVQRNIWQTTAHLQSNDLRVEPAWIQGYTGCGSVVGVVDDG